MVNFERSQNAHRKLMKKFSVSNEPCSDLKFYYHHHIYQCQKSLKRVLTNEEKNRVYNSILRSREYD